MARRTRAVSVYALHLYERTPANELGRHVGSSVFVFVSDVANAIAALPLQPRPSYDTLRRRLRDGRPFRLAAWFARIELLPLGQLVPPAL